MWKYNQTDNLYSELTHSDINTNEDYLMHYGILGMKWRHHKPHTYNYTPNSIRARIARSHNDKIDKSFRDWRANAKQRDNTINLGKKRNESYMNYQSDKKNKNLKKQYKADQKAYKKSLRKNTTYRKGQVRQQVDSDLSRRYLSAAKNIKKQIKNNPKDKKLSKQYNKYMSEHDVTREKARKAISVASRRSNVKANAKRALTSTVKGVAATGAVMAGSIAVNKYLTKHNVRYQGHSVQISQRDLVSLHDIIQKGKIFMGYMY